MLKPIAFANAFTIVGVGVYTLCRVLSLVMPNLLFSVIQSWFHAFSMDAMRVATPIGISSFLFGAVALAALVWVSAYTGAALYNRWAK